MTPRGDTPITPDELEAARIVFLDAIHRFAARRRRRRLARRGYPLKDMQALCQLRMRYAYARAGRRLTP